LNGRVGSAFALWATLFAVGSPVRAEPAANLAGKERTAADPKQQTTAALDTALYPARALVDLTIATTSNAQTLIEDQQVVPRTRNLLFSRRGEIGVFPTAFFETGLNPNVGARMVASVDRFASTLRVGYGGQDKNLAESRLRWVFQGETPFVLTTEGYYERAVGGFAGFGPQPERDARNAFRVDQPLRSASFVESRQRAITSLGRRLAANVEVIVSTSVQIRRIEESPEAGAATFGRVFDRRRVPGAVTPTARTYNELTLRVDTRENRGTPVPGQLLEGYVGISHGIRYTPNDHGTVGLRAASFLAVVRPTNILSPRLAVDAVVPFGEAPIGFREARAGNEFRGFDGRVDNISVVASLDYRWAIARYVAARLFVDSTTVTPTLKDLDLRTLRYAVGGGIDLHTSTTEVGRIAVALGEGSARFLFSYGLPPAGFGDRQHR
jgi:hypothetical protein